TGVFLGEADGSLMTQLLHMGIFRQVTLYDYQAMCKLPYHHHSGARSLLNVRYCAPCPSPHIHTHTYTHTQ
ncbi:hypothetical protein FKM82_026501, partial [Ascaphus truei]